MKDHDKIFSSFIDELTRGKRMQNYEKTTQTIVDEYESQYKEDNNDLSVFNYDYYGTVEIENDIVEFKGVVEIVNGEIISIGDIDYMSVADENVQTVEKWFNPMYKQHSLCVIMLKNFVGVTADIINKGWEARKEQLENLE